MLVKEKKIEKKVKHNGLNKIQTEKAVMTTLPKFEGWGVMESERLNKYVRYSFYTLMMKNRSNLMERPSIIINLCLNVFVVIGILASLKLYTLNLKFRSLYLLRPYYDSGRMLYKTFAVFSSCM